MNHVIREEHWGKRCLVCRKTELDANKSSSFESPLLDDIECEIPKFHCDCQGWRRMVIDGQGCIPTIDEKDGHICGCDDEFELPIVFCPWCGDRL